MKRYIYCVVIVSSDHNAKTAVIAGSNRLKGMSLSKVLERGWLPVRETPMGGTGERLCSLILLEKDGVEASEPVEHEQPKAQPAKKAKAAVPAEPAAPAADAAEAAPAAAVAEPVDIPDPDASSEGEESSSEKVASDSDISFDFLDNIDD